MAIVELVGAGAVAWFVIRSFWHQGVGKVWWIALIFAAVIGGGIGKWLGCDFSYQPTSGLVVYSFPVPGGFYVLETYANGKQAWVDFITPAPNLVAIADACFWLGVSLGLVWLAHRTVGRRPSEKAA